jgi:hypothetical protein
MSELRCRAGGKMTYRGQDDDWYGGGDFEVYDCTCEQGSHWIELPD